MDFKFNIVNRFDFSIQGKESPDKVCSQVKNFFSSTSTHKSVPFNRKCAFGKPTIEET